MLYAFFWVIPRRLNFICRRFGTLCSIFIGWQVHLPAYEDGTECSETSAYKIQRPGNHPKESVKHSGHGESLKSRIINMFRAVLCSSSGGQIVLLQHLVSSFSVNGCTVCRLKADCSPLSDAVIIQFNLLKMSTVLLETC